MSIDHGKLLALADEISATVDHCSPSSTLRHEWAERLRALAQPAEAVDGGLGRFGHHPDPATDFEVEVESLQGRLFNARHGIAKMGEQPETVGAVTDAIERAMRFKVGGDPGAVYAKSLLRALVNEATTDAAQGAVAWMNKHGSVMTDELKQEFLATGGGFHVGAAGYDQPLYTHPQAAPAQGDGMQWYGPDASGAFYIKHPSRGWFRASEQTMLTPEEFAESIQPDN